MTIDGNEAAAFVAHRVSEVIAIYPITPSTPMVELADEWSAQRQPNIWSTMPTVTERYQEYARRAETHPTKPACPVEPKAHAKSDTEPDRTPAPTSS